MRRTENRSRRLRKATTKRTEYDARRGFSESVFIRLAFVALVSISLSSHARADIDDGLIAHWNFDDCVAIDATGNGYDGTASGNPVCGDGFEGKAFDFDGINDHIRLARSLDANNVRAISFWINSRGPDGRNDGGLVLAKYSWFGNRSFLIYTHNGTTSAITAVFFANGRTQASDNISSFYEDPDSLDPKKYTVINNSKLITNTWEHVVVNVTESDIEIWINGQITNKVKRTYMRYHNSSEPTYIGNAFNIGRDFSFDYRPNGVLDNYRIYDRPLTDDEIQELALRKLSIRPTAGGDTGDVTVGIYGHGFHEGSEVRLVKEGETNLVGTDVSIGPYGRTISTTFDLSDKPHGLWDVVVESPNGSFVTIDEGFRIEEEATAQIWVDIVGRDFIRAGRTQTFHIVYGNRGNVDAVGIPLWIAGIPKDATMTLGFDVSTPAMLVEEEPKLAEEFPLPVELEGELVTPVIISRIPPGKTASLQIQIAVPQNAGSFSIRAWMNSVFAGKSPLEILADSKCITDILLKFAPDHVQCAATLSEGITNILYDVLRENKLQGIFNYMTMTAGMMKDCANFGYPERLETAQKMISAFKSGIEIGEMCGALFSPSTIPEHPVTLVRSFDPNDKIGSNGAGVEHYLSGEEPLRYSIYFENLENATASAQEIIITDQLDSENIDLETISLGPISFGDVIVTPPGGVDSFITDVDLRPSNDILVRIKANLDQKTGLLTWKFTAIDPATGKLPEDPLAGFLPPNLVPPEGDGSVLFTVMPKPGLPTNTEITNDASIVFDTNPPILTPVWSNLLDNSVPESDMSPLAATQEATDFVVAWGGVDEGAGIKDYTVYVSVNDGPYAPAFVSTDATSGTFSGEDGKSYNFYSVARDQAGNVEEVPIFPDTSTIVRVVGSVSRSVTQGSPPLVTLETSSSARKSGNLFIFANAVAEPSPYLSCDRSSSNAFPFGVDPTDCTASDPLENEIVGIFFVTEQETVPPTLFMPSAIATGERGPASSARGYDGPKRRETLQPPIPALASQEVGAALIPDQVKPQGRRGPEADPSLPSEHRRSVASLVDSGRGSHGVGIVVLLALLLGALLWLRITTLRCPRSFTSAS